MIFSINKVKNAVIAAGVAAMLMISSTDGPAVASAEPLSSNIKMSVDAFQEGTEAYYELEMTSEGRLLAHAKGVTDDGITIPFDAMATNVDKEQTAPTVIRVLSYPDKEDPRYIQTVHPTDIATAICIAMGEGGHYKDFIVESFDWKVLAEIERILPDVITCAMYSQQPAWGRSGETLRPYEKEPSPYLAGLHIDKFKGNPVWAAHSLGIDMVAPYYKDITIQQIEDANGLGMEVRPWKSSDMEISVGGITPAMAALLNKN